MVGDHCRDREKNGFEFISNLDEPDRCLASEKSPTDCGKDVGEAEVIHGVEGEEVVEKLLLLVVAAEEGVPFVEFSDRKHTDCFRMCKSKHT